MNKTIAGANKPSAEDVKRENDYRAREDVRTLHTAHVIKKDPARHGRAKAKMKEHMASLKAMMSGGDAPKGDKENAADRAGPDSELGMPY